MFALLLMRTHVESLCTNLIAACRMGFNMYSLWNGMFQWDVDVSGD